MAIAAGEWGEEAEVAVKSGAFAALALLAGTLDGMGAEHTVPFVPSASDTVRQGFVRVINHGDDAGEVSIEAVDDGGTAYGPLTLSLDADQTRHFNSDDLETGNAGKGLAGSTGAGSGDWRLILSSDLDIEVLAYIRTTDGFLTAMHDAAPAAGRRHRIAMANPGSNLNQVSRLRLVNPGATDAEVTITGVDDDGASPGDGVVFSIPAGASRTYTAAELETGFANAQGSLGDGAGKWQLLVESEQPLVAMSLLASPTGHLTNLSTATRGAVADTFRDRLASGGFGPEMVVIPAGSFEMGCLSDDDDCTDREFPVHRVTIARPFALSKYEVTLDDWNACADAGPCEPRDSGQIPVELTHDLVLIYLNWLRAETGHEYRLPSEAEWEYAARAGSTTKYPWGDTVILGGARANCNLECGDVYSGLAPVGSFRPNAWGLHDMIGNAREWMADSWYANYEGAPSDARARLKSGEESWGVVVRGGSYRTPPSDVRAARRDWDYAYRADQPWTARGVRLARPLGR